MKDRSIGVLAGDCLDRGWLRGWLSGADQILAADGGGDHVVACGYKPSVLLGDMDSVSAETLAQAELVERLEDQDSSDCEKLLRVASARNIERLVLCGMEGSRIDHMLFALQCVARWPGSCLLAYRSMLGIVLRGGEQAEIHTRGTFSAIPLESSTGVSMRGVRWPVVNGEMSAGTFASVSNEAEGVASVSLKAGLLLVVWASDGQPVWDWSSVGSGVIRVGGASPSSG